MFSHNPFPVYSSNFRLFYHRNSKRVHDIKQYVIYSDINAITLHLCRSVDKILRWNFPKSMKSDEGEGGQQLF